MRILTGIVVIAALIFLYYMNVNKQKAAQKDIEEGIAFLKDNKLKDGVLTTDSGLQYQVLEAGTGTEHPKATDKVTVHYHGTLVNGTVFDSSVDRGQTIEFPLNRVIKGWTEGLQLMVVGEKTRFFIPSDLGYGNRSAGSIPAGAVIIFDVELVAIN